MKTAAVEDSQQRDEALARKGKHFIRMLQSIEVLHRRFLDVLTLELGRREKTLSSVQALILSHAESQLVSVGELHALGYYEGTNLSYNVGKLADDGYITLARPQWDKRSILIELTPQGREVAGIVSEVIERHGGLLSEAGISEADLSLTTHVLDELNRFWSP